MLGSILIVVVLIVVIFGVAIVRSRSDARQSRPRATSDISWEQHCYKKLVRRLLGDKDAADRLIEFERSHNPDASRAALIEAAIHRLEYDRESWRV